MCDSKPTQNELYFFIQTLQRNGYSAGSIYQHFTTDHGEVISLRRTQEIVKDFKDGVRRDHFRVPGSGRPVSSSSDQNVNCVKELIEEDSHHHHYHRWKMGLFPRFSTKRKFTLWGRLNGWQTEDSQKEDYRQEVHVDNGCELLRWLLLRSFSRWWNS